MKVAGTDRQEQILDVAIRRFSHFGVQKTTMTEIADDLGMTKQALAYYFPDKQSLSSAIEGKITDEYITELERSFSQATTTKDALAKLIMVKRKFLEKYYMLIAQAESGEIIGKKYIADSKKQVQRREVNLLKQVFIKGVAAKELKPLDTDTTISLFLDTLSAFAYCIRDKGMVPDPNLFEQLSNKQQDVMQIFYNGLKA
jgi:TetR/AcrR family transcriptional repressor of mexJK operon